MLSDHDDARVALSRAATRISEHNILLLAGDTTPLPTIPAYPVNASNAKDDEPTTTTAGLYALYALYALTHTYTHARTRRNGEQTCGDTNGKVGKNIKCSFC